MTGMFFADNKFAEFFRKTGTGLLSNLLSAFIFLLILLFTKSGYCDSFKNGQPQAHFYKWQSTENINNKIACKLYLQIDPSLFKTKHLFREPVITITSQIFNRHGKIIFTNKTVYSQKQIEAQGHQRPFFLLNLPCHLSPGNYYVIFKTQNSAQEEFVFQKSFNVTRVSGNSKFLSDILCATKMKGKDSRITPYPAKIYGKFQQQLFTYFEIKSDNTNKLPLYYYLSLQDNRNETVFKKSGRLKSIGKQCILDSINTNKLPPGKFHLICDLKNAQQQRLVRKRTDIEIYQDPIDPIFYASEAILADIRYALTESEFTRLNAMTDTKKRLAEIENIWQKRDPTPLTPRNELKEAYYARLNFVKEHYWYSDKPSDRGLVFLQFGYPDAIRSGSDPIQNQSFEIWRYTTTSREFTFLDDNGLGNFQMVDVSTARN